MNDTGQQLHPNWRALSTVNIPLKRFIKEGSNKIQQGTHSLGGKHQISGLEANEIKDFYEELVSKEDKQTKLTIESKQIGLSGKYEKQKLPLLKETFEVKNYFRFAMENKVHQLKMMDLNDKNLNICDDYGWSALMMASCEGAYDSVEYLLSIGLDKSIKDKTGKTAKELAYKKGYLKIVELLDGAVKEIKTDIWDDKIKLFEPYYCEICKQHFKETSQNQHQTSTVHQFNLKSTLPPNKLQKFNISSRNKGLQLMVKQGWDIESGLGPSQSGRLYPVKTVIRKQRTGLGIEQEAARVTHFEAYDLKAVQRHNSDYYKKKSKNRNDIKREKVREWKRDRRLRNELN